MNLYAALYIEAKNVEKYQNKILEKFPEFELIPDVHLYLCHMQTDNKVPDLYEYFLNVPNFEGSRWDLFEGRFSPFVYLVLVIKPNDWLNNLCNEISTKFTVEVINGDYHISLAKIKKEDFVKIKHQKLLNKLPSAVECSLSVKTLEIRERFNTEKLLEINLIR